MHTLSTVEYTFVIALSLAIAFTISYYSAKYAARKGRDPNVWFFLVFLFGLAAVLILFLLPPVNKEESQTKAAPPPPPENTMHLQQWHCINTQGEQQGPLDFTAFKQLWKEGKINGRSFAWCEKLVTWHRIEEIPDLLKLLAN